jgi:hypothetical protein
MLRLPIFAASLLICSAVIANPMVCDVAKIEIKFAKSVQFPDTVETILTASIGNRATVLRYDGGIDFIGAECRKTTDGRALLIFQAYCGGSACEDLDNYGIIDPRDLRILLVPDDTNRIQAGKIFGSKVAPIKKPLSVFDAYKELFP